MSASLLFMSMSRDGCIAGPNDEPSNSGDDGFDRLHEWIVTPMEIVRVIDTPKATRSATASVAERRGSTNLPIIGGR